MRKKKWKLKYAKQFVHDKRSKILPNDGFLKELEDFEKELKLGDE